MNQSIDAIQAVSLAMGSVSEFIRLNKEFANVEGFLHPVEGYALYWLARNWPVEGATAEIGSFKGRSTCWLATGCKEGRKGLVTAIDHFRGSPEHQQGKPYQDKDIVEEGTTYQVFTGNLRRFSLQDYVKPRIGSSAEAVVGWSDPIRLLFIDGDHSYEASKLDFELWAPFVPVHGLVVFHDIHAWDGVTKFFQELTFQSAQWRPILQLHSLAVVQRIA